MCANALRERRLREVRVLEKGSEAGMEENKYRLRYFWAGHSVATTHSCLLRHMGRLQRRHMDPPHFRTVAWGREKASKFSHLFPFSCLSSVKTPPPHPTENVTWPFPQPPREQEPLRGQPSSAWAQVSLLSGGSGFVAMRPSSKAHGLRGRQDEQLWDGT